MSSLLELEEDKNQAATKETVKTKTNNASSKSKPEKNKTVVGSKKVVLTSRALPIAKPTPPASAPNTVEEKPAVRRIKSTSSEAQR